MVNYTQEYTTFVAAKHCFVCTVYVHVIEYALFSSAHGGKKEKKGGKKGEAKENKVCPLILSCLVHLYIAFHSSLERRKRKPEYKRKEVVSKRVT